MRKPKSKSTGQQVVHAATRRGTWILLTLLVGSCRLTPEPDPGDPADGPSLGQEVRWRILDGVFSLADAISLADGPLSPPDKQRVLAVLGAYPYTVRQEALDHLGITEEEFEHARDTTLLAEVRARLAEELTELAVTMHDGSFRTGGKGALLGLRLGARVIPDDDPLITQDPVRRGDSGDKVFLSTFWRIQPELDLRLGDPSGAFSPFVGFRASASVEAVLLTPYCFPPDLDLGGVTAAVQGALRQGLLELPLHWDDPLPRGAEMVLGGDGRLQARAGGGLGRTLWEEGGERLELEAGASAGVTLSRTCRFQLRVKELGDGLRSVVLTRGQVGRVGAGGKAGAGVTVDLHQDLGLGARLVEGPVNSRLGSYLGADFSANLAMAQGEEVVATFLFDLRPGDGGAPPAAVAEAYDSLLRLDATGAEDLARAGGLTPDGRPTTGVAWVHVASDYRVHDRGLFARIGRVQLLSRISNLRRERGTVETLVGPEDAASGEVDGMTFHRVQVGRERSGLLSSPMHGDRVLQRELITTRDAAGREDYYYHLTYAAVEDRSTDGQDLLHFLLMARSVGALAGEEHLLRDVAFLESFDDTTRMLDVYFTREGMDAVFASGEDRLRQEFARAYQAGDFRRLTDPDRMGVPWLRGGLRTADEALRREEALAMVRVGRATSPLRWRSRVAAYRELTGGRSLDRDIRFHEQMEDTLRYLDQVRSAPDPEQRARAFAEGRGELRMRDFEVRFAALAAIAAGAAGGDGAVVERCTLTRLEDGSELVFARQGEFFGPMDRIRAAAERLQGGGGRD